MKSDLNIGKNFHNGLDVGCGAGLSTRALKLICDSVTGTDISAEMIQTCKETYDASE
ncbi:MAG: class I SAM-dependent methyltransferase, partial [Lachnospiraceae bacterium]|nr:class I SAM-dependent methyltransferase [Lachnospiraceae bacterium]